MRFKAIIYENLRFLICSCLGKRIEYMLNPVLSYMLIAESAHPVLEHAKCYPGVGMKPTYFGVSQLAR